MRTLSLVLFVAAVAAQSTRELAELNWMEGRELAPGKVHTVRLPTDTLEAHGAIANGADVIAQLAPSRAIAPRVKPVAAPVCRMASRATSMLALAGARGARGPASPASSGNPQR